MSLRDVFAATREARRFTLRAGGRRYYLRRLGPDGAPPIVLVHGLGMSGLYLLPVARRLAHDHAVWLPDLPGFGASERPPRMLAVPALAYALADCLRAISSEPVPLLANSLGCQVVVDLAARHPGLASHVVLVGPTYDPALRSVARVVPRFIAGGLREPPGLVALAVFEYLRTGPIDTWMTLLRTLHDPVEARLPLVELPALVVRGVNDPVVSQAWAERVAAHLPRGRLVVLDGGHALNYDAPAALAGLVRRFLGGAVAP